MNYDELEAAWRSPRNQPSPAEIAASQQRFTAELERKRRGAKLLLFAVFAVLTLFSVRLLGAVLWPGAGGRIDVAREWASLVFLALPWLGALALARQLVRHEREHVHPGRSLAGSVRALLDENRMSRARLGVVAALHVVMLVTLPLVVWQLRAVGKAGDEIVWPAFVGWPLVAAAILAAMAWHDRRTLRPRARQLEALLRDYERAD
jgi:hypothetical protein